MTPEIDKSVERKLLDRFPNAAITLYNTLSMDVL